MVKSIALSLMTAALAGYSFGDYLFMDGVILVHDQSPSFVVLSEHYNYYEDEVENYVSVHSYDFVITELEDGKKLCSTQHWFSWPDFKFNRRNADGVEYISGFAEQDGYEYRLKYTATGQSTDRYEPQFKLHLERLSGAGSTSLNFMSGSPYYDVSELGCDLLTF